MSSVDSDPHAAIHLAGEYDVSNAATITAGVIAALQAGHRPVVLDMTAVTFLDSTGLGAMIAARKACTAAGTALVLIDGSPAVRKILDITGTADLFAVAEPG